MTQAEITKTRAIFPLADRVVVKEIIEEERTAYGLTIPESGKQKPQRGEVLRVGPGRMNDKGERLPISTKVGDKIFFVPFSGVEVKTPEGDIFLLVEERNILGVTDW